MSRLVDVFVLAPNYRQAVEISHRVVQEHVAGVSYLIPGTMVYRRDGCTIRDSEKVLLIMKTTDTLIHSRLIPVLQRDICGFVSLTLLPAVNTLLSYRDWIFQEVSKE